MPSIELNVQNILIAIAVLAIFIVIALIRSADSDRRRQRKGYEKWEKKQSKKADRSK